jgi:dTDP-4-dehydrorhamnose reductase
MTRTAPILVTGATGQVGDALVRLAKAQGIEVDAPGRDKLDLANADSIASTFKSSRWSAVINCAAYTAVDKAETDAELAHLINATAPGLLAEAAAAHDIPIVQVSTDYVFDGTNPKPYLETDVANPLGVYGRTKEAGEVAVRSANKKHAIVRTAWVVSAQGHNFLNTMLNLGATKSELNVVDDQLGCPSSAADIAKALLQISQSVPDCGGTWHFVNSGEATWFDLANHIFGKTAKYGLPAPTVRPIPTSMYPTPAKRPANSRLCTNAVERDFNIQPRPWRTAIDEILLQRLGDKG